MDLKKLLYFVGAGALLGLVLFFTFSKSSREEILEKAREAKETKRKENEQTSGQAEAGN